MKILLTGANGQLGRCLQERAEAGTLTACTRQQLDISDEAQVRKIVAQQQPTLLINAAAYTAVDKAEQEPEQARRVNALGPAVLAKVCAEREIPLIHISTDYVFDGRADRPYRPEAPIHPLGVYGGTKAEGEAAVRQYSRHLIIRTAWVFSEYGNNFVKTMLRLGREREQLSIVGDQIGCPTYAGHIAELLLTLANRLADKGFARWGTYHFTGDQPVSWFEFAQAIFETAERRGLIERSPALTEITTADYPTPAARPAYSVLDNRTLEDLLGGEVQRDWRQGLEIMLGNWPSPQPSPGGRGG